MYNVRTEAIEATLEEIRTDTPKAAQAKAADFGDPRFVNELKQSVYLERIWKQSRPCALPWGKPLLNND
jgi:hypothetical protein